MNDTDKILIAIKEIKEDIKEIRVTQAQEKININIIKDDIKDIRLDVALLREQNKKDHIEILDMLTRSEDTSYQQIAQSLKKLDERITTLEGKN